MTTRYDEILESQRSAVAAHRERKRIMQLLADGLRRQLVQFLGCADDCVTQDGQPAPVPGRGDSDRFSVALLFHFPDGLTLRRRMLLTPVNAVVTQMHDGRNRDEVELVWTPDVIAAYDPRDALRRSSARAVTRWQFRVGFGADEHPCNACLEATVTHHRTPTVDPGHAGNRAGGAPDAQHSWAAELERQIAWDGRLVFPPGGARALNELFAQLFEALRAEIATAAVAREEQAPPKSWQ